MSNCYLEDETCPRAHFFLEHDMSQPGTGSLNPPQVFQCMICREVINTAMTNCPYCGVEVKPDAAQSAADTQSQVAEAFSNASYLKIMARAMVGFFLASWIPFIGIASWGFLVLLVLIPILLIRWWIKYRGLQTADPDFEEARRNTVVALVIWCGIFVVWFAAGLIQVYLLMLRQ
jgi:hypothetical protein